MYRFRLTAREGCFSRPLLRTRPQIAAALALCLSPGAVASCSVYDENWEMGDDTAGESGGHGGHDGNGHGGGIDAEGDCLEGFSPEGDLGNGSGAVEGLGSFVYVAWRGDGYVAELSSWAALGGPNTPGEYPISEPDADPDDCGLCLYFYDHAHTFLLMPIPDRGKIVIEAIPEELGSSGVGERFAGRHEGLVLRPLDLAGRPVPDGCTFELPAASWNLILEERDDDDGDGVASDRPSRKRLSPSRVGLGEGER